LGGALAANEDKILEAVVAEVVKAFRGEAKQYLEAKFGIIRKVYGWGTWIRTKIGGVRVASLSP
jgi:hypothetical protein